MRAYLLLCLLFGVTYSWAVPSVPPTLDEKIGQMLMVGFDGLKVDQNSAIVRDIQQYHLGGVVLYEHSAAHTINTQPAKRNQLKNIKNPKQLRELTRQLQHYSQIPLFIAIDQEGGRVNRLRPENGFAKSLSAARLGRINKPSVTNKYASAMARTLAQAGINVNFAPVVDLNSNPHNPVIGKLGRAFSNNPQIVSQQASIFADNMRQRDVICTLKHFPGHGSSRADSHKGFVNITRTWRRRELQPYEHLFNSGHGCDMVMVAHVYNAKLDKHYPASLSRNIVTGLLRKQLHFDGIVVTDDLQMGAIDKNYSLADTLRLAINAGDDILVFSSNLKSQHDSRVAQIVTTIKQLIKQGKIKQSQIDDAYYRIIKLKRKHLAGFKT
ncbi:MAG: glycoside hydrolase family 3 protein [Gammaproteobacteria bacterium]